jgi:hypothetical protein
MDDERPETTKQPRFEREAKRSLSDVANTALHAGVGAGVGTIVGLGAKDAYEKIKESLKGEDGPKPSEPLQASKRTREARRRTEWPQPASELGRIVGRILCPTLTIRA